MLQRCFACFGASLGGSAHSFKRFDDEGGCDEGRTLAELRAENATLRRDLEEAKMEQERKCELALSSSKIVLDPLSASGNFTSILGPTRLSILASPGKELASRVRMQHDLGQHATLQQSLQHEQHVVVYTQKIEELQSHLLSSRAGHAHAEFLPKPTCDDSSLSALLDEGEQALNAAHQRVEELELFLQAEQAENLLLRHSLQNLQILASQCCTPKDFSDALAPKLGTPGASSTRGRAGLRTPEGGRGGSLPAAPRSSSKKSWCSKGTQRVEATHSVLMLQQRVDDILSDSDDSAADVEEVMRLVMGVDTQVCDVTGGGGEQDETNKNITEENCRMTAFTPVESPPRQARPAPLAGMRQSLVNESAEDANGDKENRANGKPAFSLSGAIGLKSLEPSTPVINKEQQAVLTPRIRRWSTPWAS